MSYRDKVLLFLDDHFYTICKYVFMFIFGLSIYVFLHYMYEPAMFTVRGASMFPTVCPGDTCITIAKFDTINRGDIVTFFYKNLIVIKRVIACPGDIIEIEHGMVFVNGLVEDTQNLIYEQTNTRIKGVDKLEVILGKDEYFCLGDCRPLSTDSRVMGPINRSVINNKVIFRWRSLRPVND